MIDEYGLVVFSGSDRYHEWDQMIPSRMRLPCGRRLRPLQQFRTSFRTSQMANGIREPIIELFRRGGASRAESAHIVITQTASQNQNTFGSQRGKSSTGSEVSCWIIVSHARP